MSDETKHTPEPFTKSERVRLFDICERSKSGRHVSNEEHNFASEMFERDGTEYADIHSEACHEAISRVNPLYEKPQK